MWPFRKPAPDGGADRDGRTDLEIERSRRLHADTAAWAASVLRLPRIDPNELIPVAAGGGGGEPD